jgi:hypothetical protein
MKTVAGWFRRPWVLASFVAVLLSTAIAWCSLDLWAFRWDVPLEYTGDGLAVAAHLKTVLETGWYESQAALGAPYGQIYHDYPASDNLHFAVAALLGLVLPSWGAVMNVHFLLGFPLAALAGLWFLRRVGVTPIVATALATLFAVAPYHFLRGEGHLFLSWYWVVPLGLGLVLAVLRRQPLWGARPAARHGLGHLTGPTGLTLFIAVLLASASAYYAVFTIVLGAVAALGAVLVTRDWRRLLGTIGAAAAILGGLVANMLPDLLYAAVHGSNAGAFQRTPVGAELYGLKLAQLILPASNHRFGPFHALREQYDAHFPLPSEGPALGLIAATGFVALVVVAMLVVVRAAIPGQRGPAPLLEQLAPLSFVTVTAFLFATVGGLSTLVAFVLPSVRAWNRISIALAALALGAIGLLVDAFVARAGARRKMVTIAATAVLLAVGVWDQTPAADPVVRAATVASFDSDAQFVRDIESRLPPRAMLFQLPYIDFPESPPVHRALDADQLRPFLHATDVRFSGGGIRGRDDIDALGDVADLPVERFVDAAVDLGFAGVIVDTFAYDGDAPVAALKERPGASTVVSPDGRFIFVSF